MIAIQVQIDTAGLEALLLRIKGALNTEAILDEGAAILLNRVRTRFLAEKTPDGESWIPSKAGMYRRAHGGTGTLFKSGRLFRSIQLTLSTAGRREIGTDVPYAKAHQEGQGSFSYKTKNDKIRTFSGFPARPFLGFADDDIDVMTSIVVKRIKEALGD